MSTELAVPTPGSTLSRTTLSTFSTSSTSSSHSLNIQTSSTTSSPYSQPLSQTVSSLASSTLLYHSQESPSSVALLPATSSTTVSRNSTYTPHKLSAAIIVLLAVGSAALVLGLLIVYRAYSRPARRTRPKPSLPILDNSFDDELYKTKESPLFGGAERFSSQTGLDGSICASASRPEMYSTVIPPVPPLPSSVSGIVHSPGNDPTGRIQPLIADVTSDGYLRPPPSQSVPTLGSTVPCGSSLQKIQPARTLPNRLSARTLSIYPATPITSNEKFYTADDYDDLNRSSKLLLRRSLTDGSSQLSSLTRSYSVDLAYDGVDITSPQFLAQFPELPPTPAGRSKIKSTTYTPGSYPRMSSIPSSTSSKIRINDINYPAFDLQQLPPIHRNGDNRALTTALGLMSPAMETVPLSPQTTVTLTPDDSMSVLEKKTHKRPLKKPVPSGSPDTELGAMSPTTDTCTALGSLMLVDYSATSKSLSSRLGDSNNDLAPKGRIPLHNDRPPRVPSPPCLPSLAQMGLENTDPVAYASYRSPTYSIFGMYEADRKSRMSLHSGTADR
ncbi:hypothetical protein K435DRAFT_969514 [Dendrothele bispora CBS 962.96]|uniref:Uncharacterized protein n=1 Tax=Dendrothele bispora (strain CBS 962.96) TaxID=1314807 RepID=A0A4V4HDT1_DENBC|nr:hypothetical protein K435DRAFT_969514 [Dendrothele bispora CBS 962.96]